MELRAEEVVLIDIPTETGDGGLELGQEGFSVEGECGSAGDWNHKL